MQSDDFKFSFPLLDFRNYLTCLQSLSADSPTAGWDSRCKDLSFSTPTSYSIEFRQ